MNLNEVRAFAREKHGAQKDKQGRDYYDGHLRPIAEALRPFGEDAEAAGWLHDVLEDTPAEAVDLVAAGVPAHVVAAVESVTKREDEKDYLDLIARSAADPLGRLVKLADNSWNILSNPALAATEPERAAAMLNQKYLPARELLLAACDWSLDSAEVAGMYEVLRGHLDQRT
ncbi:(p)ppGpp synthase/HD superfamily hydrolase [Marmoricola sp. OAE513]|uniref:phosphohydrolase n=1 Tax=Marmoricola sp. OAE513 TaxID=2817894 RepID=UPI001AE215DC